MQCLVYTYIHELKEESVSTTDYTGSLFPIQIIIPTLKSQTEKYKAHWVALIGNELFWYKDN